MPGLAFVAKQFGNPKDILANPISFWTGRGHEGFSETRRVGEALLSKNKRMDDGQANARLAA